MKKIVNIVYILLIPLLMGMSTLRDPTQPPNTGSSTQATTSGKPLVLTGIFIYADKKVAIIDGQESRIGDQIGEYTITDIQLDSVNLIGPQFNKETIQLVPSIKRVIPVTPKGY